LGMCLIYYSMNDPLSALYLVTVSIKISFYHLKALSLVN
jgi:hypothetical protein